MQDEAVARVRVFFRVAMRPGALLTFNFHLLTFNFPLFTLQNENKFAYLKKIYYFCKFKNTKCYEEIYFDSRRG